MNIEEKLSFFKQQLPENVTLVAVSKTQPVSSILSAYHAGQRVFGENKIQEMAAKWEQLPKDIQWHMIGHVQTNKVKYMAPFVSLIHGVDSIKILKEIDKQAQKQERIIDCLLQVHIASEATKFGLMPDALAPLLSEATHAFKNVCIKGLMGMATFTEDKRQIRNEFFLLNTLFQKLKTDFPQLEILSMGMSSDYLIAMEEGSTMVRIGSSIFGPRNY